MQCQRRTRSRTRCDLPSRQTSSAVVQVASYFVYPAVVPLALARRIGAERVAAARTQVHRDVLRALGVAVEPEGAWLAPIAIDAPTVVLLGAGEACSVEVAPVRVWPAG